MQQRYDLVRKYISRVRTALLLTPPPFEVDQVVLRTVGERILPVPREVGLMRLVVVLWLRG